MASVPFSASHKLLGCPAEVTGRTALLMVRALLPRPLSLICRSAGCVLFNAGMMCLQLLTAMPLAAQQLPDAVIADTVPVPTINDVSITEQSRSEQSSMKRGSGGPADVSRQSGSSAGAWKSRTDRTQPPGPSVTQRAVSARPVEPGEHPGQVERTSLRQVQDEQSSDGFPVRDQSAASDRRLELPPGNIPSEAPLPVTSMAQGPVDHSDSNIVSIPFRNGDTVISRRDLQLRMNNGLITLIATDANLKDILSILAADHGLNLVTSDSIDVKVSVTLKDIPLADALNAILSIHGLSWTRRNNIISISQLSMDQAGGAMAQGRVVRVYPLSYVRATDLQSVVQGLLSPVGTVQTMASDSTDTRKSRDRLIVEDMPDYLERVDSCVGQLDQAPQQVQILAHVLEVQLSAGNRHGVNLEALTDIAGTKLSFKTPGFASPGSSPSMLFGLNGSKLDSLVDALINTTDARTLASPRIMVTHGQEAKIQIGGRIGFRQSTTTETSTIQGVEFLDVGVVLTVTPYIGETGQILLKVRPEVSDGQLNVETELPDEKLTMVESTVLLNNGQGMVIGGLIREDDTDRRNKIPILGQMWMVGGLFQNVRQERSRTEVIVVIQSTIVPQPCPLDEAQHVDVERASTPLFHGPLQRQYRPWEPPLPEVVYRPETTLQNFREFRDSDGTRILPETPRTPSSITYGTRFATPPTGETASGRAPHDSAIPPAVPPIPGEASEYLPSDESGVNTSGTSIYSQPASIDVPYQDVGDDTQFMDHRRVTQASTPTFQTSVTTSIPVRQAPALVQQAGFQQAERLPTPGQITPNDPGPTVRTGQNQMLQPPPDSQKLGHNRAEKQFPPSQRYDHSAQSSGLPAASDTAPSAVEQPSWFRRFLPGRKK